MATKLYFHDAATGDTGSLPGGSTIGGVSPTNTASGASTNRSMDEKIGTSQTSGAITSNGTGQINWFRRFLSQPVAAQTISGTYVYSGAVQMSSAAASHSATIIIGLWRPSSGSLVGLLYNRNTNDFAASGTSETAGANSANALTSQTAQDGDILVVEIWGTCSRSGNTTYTEYYDGTTEASSSSNAAFVNLSQTIKWFVGPTAALSFAGSTTRPVAAMTRSIADAVLSFAGQAGKRVPKGLTDAALSFTGAYSTIQGHWFAQALSATLTSAGAIVRQTQRTIFSGAPWTKNPTFTPDANQSIAYGNGVWVVAASLKVYTATDPTGTWTQNATSFPNQLASVAYGNGVWVVVGNAGNLYTATDPTGTWTSRTSSFGSTGIQDVAYDGSTNWVAVGQSGKIATATDPTGTWTQRTSPFAATDTIQGVAYGAGSPGAQWVACGNTTNVFAVLATATDPTGTWTLNTVNTNTGVPFSSVQIILLRPIYAGGNWSIVTFSFISYSASDPTSTFTQRGSNIKGNGQAYDGIGTIAICGDGTANGGINPNRVITTSSDGITWTIHPGPVTANLEDIAYGNGYWVAVGVMGSTTGVWTAHVDLAAAGQGVLPPIQQATTFSKRTGKALSGTASSTGSVARTFLKALTAAASFVGSFASAFRQFALRVIFTHQDP